MVIVLWCFPCLEIEIWFLKVAHISKIRMGSLLSDGV